MAECKDCNHYEVCLIHCSESVLKNRGICKHFKIAKGQWSEVKTISGLRYVGCSVCDYKEYHHTYKCNRLRYCPHCGAKMDGDADENHL